MRPQAGGATQRLRIVYLLGFARSGTTLLGRILGHAPGAFHIGEAVNYWRWLDCRMHRCSCGDVIRDCEFWSSAFTAAGVDLSDGGQGITPARLHRGSGRRGAVARLLTETVVRTYRTLADATGSRVLIDSSKDPRYARLLAGIGDLDLDLVHVVRDPRGVTYSRQRRLKRALPSGRIGLHRGHLVRDALAWSADNARAEWLLRRSPHGRRVRYESFVQAPRSLVRDLAAAVGLTGDLGFTGERTVALDPVHSLGGNRNRFETGPVAIRMDRRWIAEMGRLDRTLVTAVTLPGLVRYGYPIAAR